MNSMETILEKFLRYTKINTQSQEGAKSFPSTNKQKVLLELLVKELQEMGVQNVTLDEYGYVMAKIPANIPTDIPPLGFIAHVDTSPDVSSHNVKAKVVEYYNGEDIVLNKKMNITLRPKDFPDLLDYVGQSIIVTDGTTLLGADDKAGIAAIMYAVQQLMRNQSIKHGDICIGFTPDEEIGRGVDFFDVEKFGAVYAYTVDGGKIGELEYENFNAAFAKIMIKGRNIHPGHAKGKMVNALNLAYKIHQQLPVFERPEHTEGYDGFFHLIHCSGNVESAQLHYLIRDHSDIKFEQRKQLLIQISDTINREHNEEFVKIEIRDQYYNMQPQIEPHFFLVEKAKRVMIELGITPIIRPIRGGTDGSRLSYMGLPCPNLFTGGHNFHSKYEFLPLFSLQKSSEVVLSLMRL
ncbi:MAG: peptidase T [Bacteroidales bacterium]